jgi:hypothetical protein
MATMTATVDSAAMVADKLLCRQRHHLRDKELGIVVGVIQLLEDGERILCVTLGSGRDAGCVQMAGVCFLNECLEVGLSLLHGGFAVPIIKFMGIQAIIQQQTHGVVEQLLRRVGIFAKDLHLLAIFALPE